MFVGGLLVVVFAEAGADMGRQALIMRYDHEYQQLKVFEKHVRRRYGKFETGSLT